MNKWAWVYLAVTACVVSPHPCWGRDGCTGRWSLAKPVPDECLEPIETDRPHLTDSPHPVPAGHAQLESGLAILEIERSGEQRLMLLEQMYKLGLVQGVDLQVLVTHAAVSQRRLLSHPLPLGVRAKLVLWKGDGVLPWTTLVPTVEVPLRREHGLRGGGFVFMGWSVGPQFELELNFGALAGDTSHTHGTAVQAHETTFASVEMLGASALTMNLYGPLGAFVEGVLVATPDAALSSAVLGTGFVFAVHRDVQLDLGSYIGLKEAPLIAPFAGVSLRL